jgi:hypothetical protein
MTAAEYAERDGLKAGTLKWWSSQPDSMASRSDDDVFTLLLPGVELVTAGAVAERVRLAAADEPFPSDGTRRSVTSRASRAPRARLLPSRGPAEAMPDRCGGRGWAPGVGAVQAEGARRSRRGGRAHARAVSFETTGHALPPATPHAPAGPQSAVEPDDVGIPLRSRFNFPFKR